MWALFLTRSVTSIVGSSRKTAWQLDQYKLKTKLNFNAEVNFIVRNLLANYTSHTLRSLDGKWEKCVTRESAAVKRPDTQHCNFEGEGKHDLFNRSWKKNRTLIFLSTNFLKAKRGRIPYNFMYKQKTCLVSMISSAKLSFHDI